MGMIYKRGNIYWIKYYENGKPHRESTKSTKETDAKRLLKKREGEISEGKLPGVYFEKVTYKEVAKDFLADYRMNQKKSLARAEHSLKHLEKAFGEIKVTNITTPKINAYIEKRLDEGAANGTINRELSALKAMLNLAKKQTPPKVNMVPYIPMLKENNVRKGFFEHGEFLALREALPDHLKGFITFGYKQGWRIAEISDLTWSQVDRDAGIVRLEPGETKNDEGRTIYLDEELREVFNRQWAVHRRNARNGRILPYVFLNREGDDKVKRFDKAWKKACRDSKIGPRLFHDFRRTAVRNMVRAGIPEKVAMMISGYKTRSVFERYNMVSDTDLRLAAQRQEEYLRAQTGTLSGTIHHLESANPLPCNLKSDGLMDR